MDSQMRAALATNCKFKVYVRVLACSLNNFLSSPCEVIICTPRTRSWPSGDDSTDLSDFFLCLFLCLALVLANLKFSEIF